MIAGSSGRERLVYSVTDIPMLANFNLFPNYEIFQRRTFTSKNTVHFR